MNRLLLLGLLLIGMTWSASAQWTQMTSDDLELPFAEAIVKHQGNWYIGTAGGVFKSTDNGLNWTLVNNNLFSVYNRLRIEGMASVGTTLIGTNRWEGIVLTTDGSSWSLPTSGLPNNYYMTELLGVVGTRIIALIEDDTTGDFALYYSTNEGSTWTKGADLPTANRDVYLFSANSKVYIVHENNSGNDEFLGVTDDGVTVDLPPFTPAYPENSIEQIVKSGDHLVVYGESSILRYDLINDGWTDLSTSWVSGIAFAAGGGNNADRIYATVLDGDLDVGAYTSSDHGDNWTALTVPVTTGKEFAMGLYATANEFMASFIDDGIHYSADAGTNIFQRNNGALATDFDDMIVSGDNILASLFISGIFASDDNGDTWSQWNTGLPVSTLQHVTGFLHDGTSLFANFYVFPDDNPEPDRVVKSDNNGASWSEITAPGTQDNLKLLGVNGSVLYAYSTTGSDKYYTSNNGGTSWIEITSNIPANFMPLKVCGDGTNAYMAGYETTSGANAIRLYISDDNGATAWTLHMNGINLANLDSRDEDDDIYLVTPTPGVAFLHIRYQGWNNKLLRWNVNTWEEATASGISNFDFEALAYNNGILYASSWSSGVYQSVTAGESFTELTGLPAGLSAEIFAFNGDQVIVSTHRGIWTHTIATHTDRIRADNKQLLYPNPGNTIVYLGVDADLVEVYSLSGQLLKSVVPVNNQLKLDGLKNGIYLVTIKTESDTYTVKLIKR